MTRGIHRVRLAPPGGELVDLSCDVTTASVHHGRDNADGQPEPSSATLEVYGPIPPGADIGWAVQVWAGLDAPDDYAQRFGGTITDLGLSFGQGTDPVTGITTVWPYTTITAVTDLAGIGRQYVGDAPWPAELDGPRVARILALCDVTPALVDPGTVTILGRDVDRQPGLDLARDVADDAGGIILDYRDGRIAYHDAEHRRAAVAALIVDACQITLSPMWVRDMSGLINEAAIGYGPAADDGGEQAVYTAESSASKDRYGRIAYYAGTQLADLPAATGRATAILARADRPAWNLTALALDLATLPAADLATLLGLEVGSLLGLTGLPLATPEPAVACWIEGWTETLTYGGHDLELAVSAYCRTAPFPRWDDMPTSRTWDTMGTTTWDQAVCIGPIVSEGRWVDVPATLYWDRVDPATTWDTWTY